MSPASAPLRLRRARSPWLVALAAASLAVLFAALPRPTAAEDPVGAGPSVPSSRLVRPWSDEVVALARTFPVQEGGRIMPLDTWAGYTLQQLSHRKACKDAEDRSINAVEWALDVLFRPSLAATHRCFLVPDTDILDSVGLAHESKKKRDRYTYVELEPGAGKLGQLAAKYEQKEAKERSSREAGVIDLARNLATFERLSRALEFTRFRAPVSADTAPGLRKVFPAGTTVRFSDLLARHAALKEGYQAVAPASPAPAAGDPHGGAKDPLEGFYALYSEAIPDATAADALHFLPPVTAVGDHPEWASVYEITRDALSSEKPASPLALAALGDLERMADGVRTGDALAFEGAFKALHGRVTAEATRRGEYAKVPLEVTYHRLDIFTWSLSGYLIAFVLTAFTWIFRSRWLRRIAWGVVLASLAYHILGITLRCVLRDRPPISTLYETTLFIAAFAVALSLVVEWFQKNGVMFALATVLGAVGLFVANRYEAMKGEDTMPQLQAVLDTNFWLATHVTCVTIGYSASLLAAAVAHVHVIGYLAGWRRADRDFWRSVCRMEYGVLCFALLFSTVGTILGGIWANESWGRFWGWDPKENGALMIVLGQLAILHGRMSGLLKPLGVSAGTILTGCIVAFSWWGVNLLGMGLHAYGFTSGMWGVLVAFWAAEVVLLLATLGKHLLTAPAAPAPTPPGADRIVPS